MGPTRRVPFLGGRRLPENEAGFTIIECTIALGLVFVVLIGLLGALTAGARGLITGRQRSAGLALANEVLEDARGRAYGDVGHDLDSDPTLATDPLISGTGSNRKYTGVTPNEPLAASAVDAGAAGGTINNPLFPFSPHIFTSKREQTTYTTSVYVTTVTPTGAGDPYKRVTVKVSWSPAQYATAAKSVTLSSFLYNATAPPDPRLTGTGEADSGSLKLTGSLGINLADMNVAFPYVSGSVDSGFVRGAKGVARTGTSQVDLVSGTLSGCTAISALSASCDGAQVSADADNDSGTAPPDTDQDGPTNSSSATISVPPVAPVLTSTLGGGTAQAQATARSCWSCQATGTLPVGDDDRLPYFTGSATGPSSVTLAVTPLVTSLLKLGTACASACAAVTVDRDDAGSNQRIASTASVNVPALGLLQLAGGPAGGVVTVGAVSATAGAGAGPGAAGPSVSGGPVTISYWNGLGYTNLLSVTPGVAGSATIPSISLLLGAVTVSGTVTANKAVTSQTSAGGAVTAASASLTNWLFIDLNVSIAGLGAFNLHLDYGRIAATAGYQPAS